MRVSSRSLQHHLIQSLTFTLFERFLIAYKAFFGHVVSLISPVGRVGVLGTVAMQVSCIFPYYTYILGFLPGFFPTSKYLAEIRTRVSISCFRRIHCQLIVICSVS